MKFGRTGLAVLGLFAVAGIGCPQPSHKLNDGGDDTGGESGDGGSPGTGGKAATGGSSGDTGGSSGATGGSSGSTGGSSGSTGGSSGSTGGSSGGAPDAGSKADGGGSKADGGGGGGAGGGADMAAFTTLYNTVIKPKCGPGCHITGTNGGLTMPNAMTAFTNLVNKPSMGCANVMRVVPGDPSKSLLSAIVKPMGGMLCAMRTNQMPKGKTPLTAAEMTMIDDWIKGP
jgi:hypothetical protein